MDKQIRYISWCHMVIELILLFNGSMVVMIAGRNPSNAIVSLIYSRAPQQNQNEFNITIETRINRSFNAAAIKDREFGYETYLAEEVTPQIRLRLPSIVNPDQNILLTYNLTKYWQSYLFEDKNFTVKFTCRTNHYGDYCERLCHPQKTYNCSNDGYRVCKEGYRGEFCRKPICDNPVCNENSFCKSPNHCECNPGWTGDKCDKCVVSQLCAHGFCTVPYGCACLPGWSGVYCNKPSAPLNQINCSCLNGGICEFTDEKSHRCLCPSFFKGDKCQYPKSENISIQICSPDKCGSNGECFSNGQIGICICNLGWTGQFCEIKVNPCMSRPCLNNGTCISTNHNNNQFTCNCTNEFHGDRCQLKLQNVAVNFIYEDKKQQVHYRVRIFIVVVGVCVLTICPIAIWLILLRMKVVKSSHSTIIDEPPSYDSMECARLIRGANSASLPHRHHHLKLPSNEC